MKSAVRNEKNAPIFICPSMTSLPPIIMTAATPIEPMVSISGLTSCSILTLFKFSLKNLLFSSTKRECSYSWALFALIISIFVKISLSAEVMSDVFSCDCFEIFFILLARREIG